MAGGKEYEVSRIRALICHFGVTSFLHSNPKMKSNMQYQRSCRGEPILGQHWVEIDLQRPQGCSISRGVLDWETAFASAYRLEGLDIEQGRWASLMPMFDDLPSSKVVVRKSKQHIVHDLKVEVQTPVSKVRVLITKPATRWGVSLWRFQVYGTCN